VLYSLLDHKYYIDRFNEIVFAGGARLLGGELWKVGDEKIIDGVMVNGSAEAVGWFATVVRRFQTGVLNDYAMTMIVGVVALISWFVVRQLVFH
jgi:NADH-quinone oxidoreductase subunit L